MNYHRGDLFRILLSHHKKKGTELTGPVTLFNAGLLPPPFCLFLQTISFSTEICHYRVGSAMATPLRGDGTAGNSLLNSFGEEQEQQVALLQEFSARNPAFVSAETLPAGKTGAHNLGAVQQSVRENRPVPKFGGDDRSIRIRSCHSPLREVEVLHRFLTGIFSERDDILPDDVLVVTPDIQTYRPFIEAVFGTREEGLPDIPFTISGSSAAAYSLVPAFKNLLTLPGGRFSKEQLFEFLQHRAIGEHFQLSGSDLAQLKSWFDENRVVWGLDGKHRAEFNQPADSLQTWGHTMRRGWLGQLTADQPGMFMEGLLLYSDILTADQKELWAKMQGIINLLKGIKSTVKEMKTAAEWRNDLDGWIDHFLPDSAVWEQEFRSVKKSVDDTFREIETGTESGSIPYSLIQQVLIDKINNVSIGSARFTGGTVFSSMVPMRSLSFKVIALIGLNDDLFPRNPVRPSFDLMAADIRPGERDRKNEDRNLFLESVMAAEEVHYTSYVGRNQKDNEAIPPSPVLDEWIQVIAGALDVPSDSLAEEQGLNGFSTMQFLPGVERSFSRQYFRIADQLQNGNSVPPFDVDASAPSSEESTSVMIEDLEHFFRNPAGYFF
ncbi:MAG: hypothetical protein WD317_01450, partial [Balneolaceae bacterium]